MYVRVLRLGRGRTDRVLVTTLLNVVSMYHDTLLSRVVSNNPSYKPLIPTTLHTRFTKAWTDKTALYKWASRALEVIKFTELMIEMGLRRKFSTKAKWRGIVLLEMIKSVSLHLSLGPMLMTWL